MKSFSRQSIVANISVKTVAQKADFSSVCKTENFYTLRLLEGNCRFLHELKRDATTVKRKNANKGID